MRNGVRDNCRRLHKDRPDDFDKSNAPDANLVLGEVITFLESGPATHRTIILSLRFTTIASFLNKDLA